MTTVTSEATSKERIWRCLHCRGSLTSDALGLQCSGCGKRYPVVAGIPILVREPAAYIRSELVSLSRAIRDAKRRGALLSRIGGEAGLPASALERHQDVIDAEIAQAETYLGLLEPAAAAVKALGDGADASHGPQRSGWAFDTLMPYLLRDWTDTSELQAASAMIGGALEHVFPDPSGKSVVFAGCGAGGLLAETAAGFERILGFDLTLPILASARHILDGKGFELTLPRSVSAQGRMFMHKREPSADTRVDVLAMDALETAFADGSVDCVVTQFLIDLMPDPRKLAEEIHRILRDDGIWISYGPSGTPKALWRFDETEGAAFFEAMGFDVVEINAHRTTNLDITRDCPSLNFRNVMCYLISARKTTRHAEKPYCATGPSDLAEIIPEHFPGANLVQHLGAEEQRKILLRYERIPGRTETVEIGSDTAWIMALVDGKRTVREIADLLKEGETDKPPEETFHTFGEYFDRGLLNWRARGL